MPPASDSWTVIAGPADVRGWIPKAGAFCVTGGHEIIVAPLADADERALRLAIVRPLLGVILRVSSTVARSRSAGLRAAVNQRWPPHYCVPASRCSPMT
jgi:hypothetical protein